MTRCTSCNRNHRSTFMRCYRCRNLAKCKERYYAQVTVGIEIGKVAGALIAQRITGVIHEPI